MEKIGLAAVLDMDDFNRNMGKYESALAHMDKTTADAAGKVGQQFVGLGDAVNKVALIVGAAFVAATAAAGVAFVKFTTDGISKAADLEEQMSSIAAVMGKTKDEIAPLKDLILDLAIDPKLKVSTFEAADAIEMLTRNGLTMTEILDGAARSTVLLANATNADFGVAADIATDVMAIFNIEAKDMSRAVDGITSVVNNSKFTIDDYALALAQGGGVAGSVGVKFDDFNATIAATSSRFGSGSDAGTSFKVFLQRLVPDTDKAADTMRELGLFTGLTKDEFQKAEGQITKYEVQMAALDPTSKNAAAKQAELADKIDVLKSSLQTGQNAFFHVDGSMRDMNEIAGALQRAMGGLSDEQRIQAASTIFGTDAMRTAVGLAEVGEEKFSALKATMGETSAEKAAAENMDNLKAAMEILAGTIEAVQLKIGDKFLPILQSLAERLNALVEENEGKLLAFFSGVADWVGEKIPLAMDWLVSTGLPAMANAFNYLTDTVFPGIAKAIAWATENWDFLSGAIKVLAGVLVTASLASTFTTIAAAVGPLISLITGAGGLVASMTGAGGLVAALGAILNPVGLVVAAVAGLALAWGLASRDTDASLVAMRENAEREANQMAVVTGETFGGWVDSVVAYHRQMKDESGLTLDEMIDNINADFWQMRQDVEASSGEMSESAIAEMNRMRLEAIKQASEMNTGVTAEVSDMAAVSAVTSEEFTARIISDANRTKEGAVGSMAEMNTAISEELDNLQVSSHLSSSEMKAGILRELNSLRIQHEDGTTTWTEGALEKIAWMSVEAQREQINMRNGVVTESRLLRTEAVAATDGMKTGVSQAIQYMKDGVILSVEQMADEVTRQTEGMQLSATEKARLMRTGMEGQLAELRDNSANMSKDQKDLILRNLDSMTVKYADGSIGWKTETIETASAMKTGVIYSLDEMRRLTGEKFGEMKTNATTAVDGMRTSTVSDMRAMASDSTAAASQQATNVKNEITQMKTGIVTTVDGMRTSTVSDMRTMASDSTAAASRQAVDVKNEYVTMRNRVADELSTMKTDNKTDGNAAGKSVSEGVKEGIEGNKSGVLSSLNTLASDMWTKFKAALGIRSPSELFAEAGYNISAGLAQGITEGQGLVSEAMARLESQTQLELNQYSAMVDKNLAATIQRYQQGLAQGQAQDAIRQGFDQGQYAAYWAAIQAGESEASAIAKGQAVAHTVSGGATTPAATPAVGSGAAAQAAATAAAQQAAAAQAAATAATQALLAAQNAQRVEYNNAISAALAPLMNNQVATLQAALKQVETAIGMSKKKYDDQQFPLESNISTLEKSIRELESNIQFGAPSGAQRDANVAQLESLRQEVEIAKIRLATLKEARAESMSPLSTRKSEIEQQIAAATVEAARTSGQKLLEEFTGLFSANRVSAALQEWEAAENIRKTALAAYQSSDGTNSTQRLQALLAANTQEYAKRSALQRAKDEVAANGTGWQGVQNRMRTFVGTTLGGAPTDVVATQLANPAANPGAVNNFIRTLGKLWQDATGQVADEFNMLRPLIADMVTLVNATATTSVESLRDEFDRLIAFRNTVSPAYQNLTGTALGNVTQTENNFNVTFQGSSGSNASVLQDIQFLNALYGAA